MSAGEDPGKDILDGTATGYGTPEERRRWLAGMKQPSPQTTYELATIRGWLGRRPALSGAETPAVRQARKIMEAHDNLIPYRRTLLVAFDVTGWPEAEIDALAGEAQVQGETSDEYTEGEEGHRNSPHTSSVVVER